MDEHRQGNPFADTQQVRGYFDGCFDIMHSGHYNAIRQAKAICDYLVVGIHSDEEIAENKAVPVMRQDERYALLEHVKWIDEILHDVPYSPQIATLDRARADFCVHGDDMPLNAQGVCAYDGMKKAGRLRIVKRTEGVSTTDIIGRLLTLSRNQHPTEHTWPDLGEFDLGLRVSAGEAFDHAYASESPPSVAATLRLCGDLAQRYGMSEADAELLRAGIRACGKASSRALGDDCSTSDNSRSNSPRQLAREKSNEGEGYRTKVPVQLLASTRRITQFATARKPGPGDRIVYACGSFDMFHVGHAEFLKEARALGTFLLVGIHDDATVTRHKDPNMPIMSLNERVLNVCACKWVDEVIIGAPWEVTPDLMRTWDISCVAHGTNHMHTPGHVHCEDQYSCPQAHGVYQEIPSRWPHLCHETIVERIIKSREAYTKRNEVRAKKEDNYYETKVTLSEA